MTAMPEVRQKQNYPSGSETPHCRPEKMRVRLAHGKQLAAILEPQHNAPVEVAAHAFHRVEVHDGRAMHLPEHGRIELVDELLDRLADQSFAVGGDDAGVLHVGLE